MNHSAHPEPVEGRSFTQWRAGILLGEAIARSPAPKAAYHAASAIDQIAAQILRANRPVAQPNWPALGLAGIEDAEARN